MLNADSGPRLTPFVPTRASRPPNTEGSGLGRILLAFAKHRGDELRPELELKATERRPVSADDFRARGVLFVPEIARLSWLVALIAPRPARS
jgi:hypothetical protein